MPTALPLLNAAFVQAQNDHASTALGARCTDDAVVYDDKGEYHGAATIKPWNDRNNEAYPHIIEATYVVHQANTTIRTAMVLGTFPDGSMPFHYHFTVSGDKLSSLRLSV